MKNIKLNTISYDHFAVNDDDGNLITGLTNGSFTKKLYNPIGNEVSGAVTVTASELGEGIYRINFTPNSKGAWSLIVTHPTYFPYGKINDYSCIENLNDDLAITLDKVLQFNSGRWKMDLNTKEMVFFKSDNITEIARFKLYNSAGQLSVENVFERRRV